MNIKMDSGKLIVQLDKPVHFSVSVKEKVTTLKLDNLCDISDYEGVNINQLYENQISLQPGTYICFKIQNEVSQKEHELFKFCKEQMKKKNFKLILSHVSDLLALHPSSVWGHFFFGVACKKIPGKEHLFVAAIAHAVSINPNFVSGWQALYKHFLGLGGFFSPDSHDSMCIIVNTLLRLDMCFDSWSAVVGHLWHYVTSNSFNENKILTIVTPYLSCDCPKRREIVANLLINFVRTKKKLLPTTFSPYMLIAFKVVIEANESETFRLGVLFAAVRYFNRTNDCKFIWGLLKFIQVKGLLEWKQMSAKTFLNNLMVELFNNFGPHTFETVFILKKCLGEIVSGFSWNNIISLTTDYSSFLQKYNVKITGKLQWARILYLQCLAHLKLYQEVYEQVLVDLSGGVLKDAISEKEYLEILVDILGHAKDSTLQRFTLRLGYKYLRMYGFDVKILHTVCLINISLGDQNTAAEMLKLLSSLGSMDDVIYLQALLEEDEDTKLDYLKTLNDVPHAHLLAATIYRDMGKSKRVVKSMLEASFYFYGGINSFEWLGIHYYERDLVVKSTKYFLEAFSNYLVSCVSVNYLISIYSSHSDTTKIRTFFDILNTRKAMTTDVACIANLKAGLNYMTKANETYDFHRAIEKFRRVTDFSFERQIIEMVADSLGYFGMHGSASDFYLMCHAENGQFHVYPSVLYCVETKMIKRKGFKYLTTTRNVAAKAKNSPFALYVYSCALFDRALSSYSVNNFGHCTFLCQQAVIYLSRCIALYAEVASFWITLGNILFTISNIHADFGAVLVPTWLFPREGKTVSMIEIQKNEAFILALRCYSVALKLSRSDDIRKLILFFVGMTFRYAKLFYKDVGNRLLYWALDFALSSCDLKCWQRNNLCGVILTSLDEYREALQCFKDATQIGNSSEDARDAEFNLGLVYLRLGEFFNAHEVFMYRRGGNPMDSMVWRSYILLHRCLGDTNTVLHYLWFLIYSIKHYPSLDQGIEYFRVICNSIPLTTYDGLNHFKKKCLLYAIFRSSMFMKMLFVGDCQVPHKFNDVTAANYYHHGELHCALGHFSTSADNLNNFLKLYAINGFHYDTAVDESLFRLAMASENNDHSLHDLMNTREVISSKLKLTKFYTSHVNANNSVALNQAFDDLEENCHSILATLYGILSNTDPSKLPTTTRKYYAEFYSRNIIRHLLTTPLLKYRFSNPSGNEDILNKIIDDIVNILNFDKITAKFLSKQLIAGLLEGSSKNK